MSKTKTFFATKTDLVSGIETIEREANVYYIEDQWYESRNPVVYQSGLEIPTLGASVTGHHMNNVRYWVRFERHHWWRVRMRKVRYRKKRTHAKKTRYDLNIEAMADGLGLHLGGLYDHHAIIPSSFGYSLPHPMAEKLYQLFSRHLLAGFTKVQDVYIGPDAAELWRNGVKLVCVVGGDPVVP